MRRPILLLAPLLAACGSSSSSTTPSDATSHDASPNFDASDGIAVDSGSVVGDDSTIFETSGDAPADDSTLFDTSNDAPASSDAAGEPALVTATFTPSNADLLEPERGWMQGDGIHLDPADDYSSFRGDGFSLAYAEILLTKWISNATIDPAFITSLDGGFAKVRAAGLKVILRFAYNDPPTTTADAPIAIITAHIAQLKGTLQKNADVIAMLQAGFIGQWGEWHDSTSGNDVDSARKQVIDAEIAALPPSRMIQVRTPAFKAALFPTPLDPSHAFDGSEQARIGHHDDCFLADATDEGTFDPAPAQQWIDYLAADTRFTPHGGETCQTSSFTTCASAQATMAKFHTSFLNLHWNPDVYTEWKNEGCFDAVARSFGYRLALTKASYSGAVKPGGVLAIHLEIANQGYASLYNARPFEIVLDDGTAPRVATLTIDPRTFAPGATSTIDAKLRIPADAKPGAYSLAIAMPDAAPTLANDPRYSIELANDGAWDATHGWNVFTKTFAIDASAIGSSDPTAKDFAPIP